MGGLPVKFKASSMCSASAMPHVCRRMQMPPGRCINSPGNPPRPSEGFAVVRSETYFPSFLGFRISEISRQRFARH